MNAGFTFPPFQVHPLLRHRHVQTIFGTVFPRRFRGAETWRAAGSRREFTMPDGDRLQGVLHQHPDDPQRLRPLLLLVSGLEGHADVHYMQGMSSKAFAVGLHSLRLNYRTCGGTDHMARKLYNGGMIADLDTVIRALAAEAPWPIVIAGVSLGANKVLRLLGTYGDTPPSGLAGGVAISPPIELARAAEALQQGFNRVYDAYFLRSLKARMRRRLAIGGNDDTDTACLRQGLRARTTRQFDESVTGPMGGYGDADTYYETASTGDLVSAIRVPTLLIHAKDDPMIAMPAFERRADLIAANPHLTAIFTDQGGHVGFLQAPTAPRPEPWMDDHWAENAAVAFVRSLGGIG
jgi:predicted alpha/beta-fold hydrolase